MRSITSMYTGSNSGISRMTLSTCDGKTFMPRIISMSSLRPMMRVMRTFVLPHAHVPQMSDVRSFVL